MPVSYRCEHPAVVPRRGTLTSNPSLNAVQTGDSSDTIYPCLGEVHALQDATYPHLFSTEPSFLIVRTITFSCPHNCLSLSTQLSLVVRTIVSRCAHNCISLCAQLHLIVHTITSSCDHNCISLCAQLHLIVHTITSGCDDNWLRL